MSALASYLRHLVVTLVFFLVDKVGLPTGGGMSEAADEVAAFVVATLTWVFLKYVLPKLKPPADAAGLFLLVAVIGTFALSSCSAIMAGISGTPVPSTTVSRPGGVPIEVATDDVIRAETGPAGRVWGLYDSQWVVQIADSVVEAVK